MCFGHLRRMDSHSRPVPLFSGVYKQLHAYDLLKHPSFERKIDLPRPYLASCLTLRRSHGGSLPPGRAARAAARRPNLGRLTAGDRPDGGQEEGWLRPGASRRGIERGCARSGSADPPRCVRARWELESGWPGLQSGYSYARAHTYKHVAGAVALSLCRGSLKRMRSAGPIGL